MAPRLLRTSALALTGVSLIALLSSPATAQTAATPAADAPVPEAQEVVITGTRIRNADFETANPVVSINAERMQQTGETNLVSYLSRLPALIGSSGPSQTAGGNSNLGIGQTGLNELNLRNLGTNRTLVLIDGRRQVGGEPGSAAVDINTIPSDLVERVDVLTGGASAVYGADGVTGVVNFILKKDFEGLNVRAQNGISSKGDGGQRLVSVTLGHNFADGRGNVALAYEYHADDRLAITARPYLTGPNAITFHNNPNAGGPTRVPLSNVRFFDTSRQGGIDIDGDGLPDYLSSGAPFNHGVFVPDFYQQGGDGTLQSDYRGDLLPKVVRNIGNFIAHYDISPALTLYAEGKYAHTLSYSISQPTFDYYIHVDPENPYIPDALKSVIADAGSALLNRDEFDLGTRGERITRNTLRGVIGAKGDLSSHLRYDASYTYSQNKITNHFIGDQYTDRFFAAVDAVPDGHGGVTCRINLDPTADINQPDDYTRTLRGGALSFTPGQCVPLNLFGEGSPSQAAKDFISVNTTDHSKLTQQVATASLSGDTGAFLNLPGGPVGFAVGAEWRRESSKDVPDPVAQEGLTFSNLTPIAKGHFDVKEAFGELDVPILKNVPLAHLLDVGGAVRFSDYSTIGHATTWRLNGQYAPIRDITFRGTYAQSVRAPNIGELFAPNGQDFEFISDPCSTANINLGKASRPANCRALLTSLGADPATFTDLNSSNISGELGGNPTLKAETARTWTAGAVIQPRFIRGLTISADWYDIRLKNAISVVDPQQLAELCVDQPDLNNQFCGAITRNNGGNQPGRITGFTRIPQNVANYATSGLDFDVAYSLRPHWDYGKFDFHLVGNYLNKLTLIGTPGADPVNYRGTYDSVAITGGLAPKYQANFDTTWSYKKLTLGYTLSWFDHVLRYSHDEVNADPNLTAPEYKYIKAHWEHDIYVSYDVSDRMQIYGGIKNLTQPKPDLSAFYYPNDSVGRFLFVGAKVKLAKLF